MPQVEVRKLWRAAWVDPAGGPTAAKHQKPRAAIVAIGQDDFERVFILDSWADRVPPDKLIDRIFDTNARWRPAVFGIDASGPQVIFSQTVQREARERGIKIALRPTALRADKTFSIETTLQPLAAAGRLFRPPITRIHSLEAEWSNFPDGFYRDQLDALACAVRLLPRTLPEHLRNMGREQLRRYLQSTGMEKSQIELQLLSVQAQS
jgi:predicted phage terminase large subunit-like protein